VTLLVFVSEECRVGARKHGLTEIIERLSADVEERQSLSQFDHFPPPYIVKKKLLGRQPRLVADLRKVGDHMVAVFLVVMIRGSNEYEDEFCRDPVAYGERNFAGLVRDDVLQAYVIERTAVGDAPGKPIPSPAEYELLYTAFSHTGVSIPDADGDDLDRIVCETHEWVEQVAESRIQTQLNRLAEPCVQALSAEAGLRFWPSKEKSGWGVWTYRQGGYVLLVRVVDGTNSKTAEEAARALASDLDVGGADALLQASRRAYPAIVLADEQLWLNLEREEIANMALSPEETEVLDSARRSDAPFPLFINGRAGSGKSTILQYLFADLLFAYGTKFGVGHGLESAVPGTPGWPLYLTANGELLRNARVFVERLLTSEARFASPDNEQSKLGSAELRQLLDGAFQEFQPFMLGLLQNDRRLLFQRSKRIDYPHFRRLWELRFGKDPRARKEHGPDVSWHVIRSYIKGMGSDEYLGPEDYEQLPENQLTVTSTMFRAVYDQVWTRWYAGVADEGYWDDQDLARHILENDLAPRCYSAVFCDEAQDFTRIELEVLLRLSLYSNRALPSDAVCRVPFAFAGDEFQTLNPTGFRWDAIKAAFVEKFIFELDPARRTEKADLNYRELRFNYRSSEPIVRFGNLVQALRSASFDIPELRPQRPWVRHKSATPVLFFKADDGDFWNAYREQTAGYVVIVPCNEGEEAEFVERDPRLREHIAVEDGVPRNVLSAGRAKGCEYPAVVVYGFGESSESDLIGTLGQPSAIEADQKRSLALQYFINRVYVAVSRAKRRLVVVDTAAGVEKLWKAAKDEFARERLVGTLKRGSEIWGAEIGGMSSGRAGDLSRDDVPDRLENARAFEDEGRARRDSYLLIQAANAYRESGDTAKWRECRAWALDYDEKALDAGTAFAEAGLFEEARRCLWRAERVGWLKLLELAGDNPELMSHLEVQWAKAAQSKADVKTAMEVLDRFAQRLENDAKFAQASYGEPVWQTAVSALLERLADKSAVSIPAVVAAGMVETLDRLERVGVKTTPRLLADICFAAGQYERAAVLWEAMGEKRSSRYLEARAQALAYPKNLEYLQRLGDARRISAAFDAHSDLSLESSETEIVSEALLELTRFDDALRLASRGRSSNALLKVAIAARKVDADEIASRALRTAVELYTLTGQWQPLTQLITNGEIGSTDAWKEKATRAWVREIGPELRVALIRALARSELLPAAPQRPEQIISKFLRDFLRVKEGKWRDRISYLEAGAAHERSGRITDSLQFYEAVLTERLGADEQSLIRMRWIAVKLRQLAYERGKSSVDSELVRKIETDLQSKLQSWRLSPPASIPDYPDLPPLDDRGTGSAVAGSPLELGPIASAVASLSPDRQKSGAGVPVVSPSVAPAENDVRTAPVPDKRVAEDSSLHFGGLRVEVALAKCACLLTHVDTMETARLEWERRRVVGTVDIIAVNAEWEIPEWKLHVSMPHGGDAAIILTLPTSRLELRILR
jgi:hypothetical protein